MSRKQRKYEITMHPADKELSLMRYADLQKACLVRGLDFKKMVDSDIGYLSWFFKENFYEKTDNTRLDAFDEWREEIMKKRGKDDPFIRLGFIGEKDEETGEVISIKRQKKFKKPKKNKKREKNEEYGIWKGTKKALTAECYQEGKTLEKTLKIVMGKFPDAKEKSISIWFKRFKRSSENKV